MINGVNFSQIVEFKNFVLRTMENTMKCRREDDVGIHRLLRVRSLNCFILSPGLTCWFIRLNEIYSWFWDRDEFGKFVPSKNCDIIDILGLTAIWIAKRFIFSLNFKINKNKLFREFLKYLAQEDDAEFSNCSELPFIMAVRRSSNSG